MRSSYGGFGWGSNWDRGETETARKKRIKEERERYQTRTKGYVCSDKGRTLIENRELVMDALRTDLSRFAGTCSHTSIVKVVIPYTDKQEAQHTIELHIPKKDFNTKPLMLWLEDQAVFRLNGKPSAFSAVSADAKFIVKGIRSAACVMSFYYKDGSRPW